MNLAFEFGRKLVCALLSNAWLRAIANCKTHIRRFDPDPHLQSLFQIFRCVSTVQRRAWCLRGLLTLAFHAGGFMGNCVHGYPRMTDKERLDAIAMNLELASIRIERTTELAERTAKLAERNAEAISELRFEGQAQRERLEMLFESRALRDLVMSLATSTEQLVATELAHQARSERLERRAG